MGSKHNDDMVGGSVCGTTQWAAMDGRWKTMGSGAPADVTGLLGLGFSGTPLDRAKLGTGHYVLLLCCLDCACAMS